MKRLVLISLFFLFTLSTVSSADDVEVFGTVKSNVAPNVLFILDNSVSMKRIEGPVGNYDNTIEYEGKFDKNKFYYRWGYTAVKGLEPLALRHADIANISCTTMKSTLQSSGHWKGTAFVYPGKDFRCEGTAVDKLCSTPSLEVKRSFYKGNYLNWYYYNVFEDNYEKTKTYIGSFASETIYKDEDSDSSLAKIKERPDAFKMGFEDANISSISENDRSISDSLKSTGYWSGDLYAREGVFFSSCEGAGGRKVLGVCQPALDILSFNDQSVYAGNYLNWFFNRTTDAYNAETKYSGGFAANRFYYISSSKTPVKNYSSGVRTISAGAIECESINTAMTNDHYWSGEACAWRRNLFDESTAYFKCSNDVDRLKDYNFYSGNYLNYFYEKRMGVAKRVMKNVLETRTDIRMGLMTFNDYVEVNSKVFEDGGKVDAFISDDSTEFLRALSNTKAITRPHSPLAETLAEAGRYFAGINGKCSNDSTARPFTSPITHWCQSNHVIIISDGSSFADADYNLWLAPYICTSDWDNDPNNDYIGDYDKDRKEWAIFGNYLDDVAKYLYDNDIYRDRLFQTPHPANKKTKQNVITHTVGFMVSGIGDILTTRKGLLRNTASQGGGSYQEVTSSADLDEKLRSSINSVLNNVLSTQNFVTPSVPVSSESQSFSGEYYYLAMFYPQSQGRWEGNLKKYETKSYMAMDKEIWTESTSREFKDGGVKEKLKTMNSSDRKIYFGNEMKEFNSVNVTKTMTSGGDKVWSDADHAKLLNSIKCGNSGEACSTGKLGEYALGDIIHFTPLFHSFKNGQAVNNRIFVGANDGMLHCIDDSTGLEKWAFIPGEQISRLKYLIPEGHKSSQVLSHEYFIDGGRAIYETSDSKKLLIFGERRGGKNYYALDVSSPDSPVFKYKVSVNDDFGQSWTSLRVVPIMYDRMTKKDIFWIGGGYDADNQDKYDKQNANTKPKDRDDVGKGIYAVDAGTGQILVSLKPSGLNNCVIEPISFNPGYESTVALEDGQKKTDLKDAHSRVYACDMAANLWGGETGYR